MKNIEIEIVDGNKLWIRIDLSKKVGRSKSDKSTIIASTGGSKTIPGTEDTAIMLTVWEEDPK